jgi:hypothetical protein
MIGCLERVSYSVEISLSHTECLVLHCDTAQKNFSALSKRRRIRK